MTDRRTDESIAPRRTLSGSGSGSGSGPGSGSGEPVLPPPPKPSRSERRNSRNQRGRAGRERRSESTAAAAERRYGDTPTAPVPVTPASSNAASSNAASSNPASSTRTAAKSPRKARLRLVQVDPWSVTKTAFLLSIALGVVSIVAVAIVWTVLGASGLWDSINASVQEALGDTNGSPFEIQDYIGTSRVLGFTMIVSVIDVVLITMIATLGAFLYNLAATLLGGIEVTLAEDD